MNITELLENLNAINDITVTPAKNGEINTFPVRVKTKSKTYEITGNGKVNEVYIADRTGIEIGDYVTYVSPTASVVFTSNGTGYGFQALTPKTLFRVLDVNDDGSMTLIGAMSSSDKMIYFDGAKAYNNGVYELNEKCSNLYGNSSAGISARSACIEDIIDRFNSTGKAKLTSYIDTKIDEISTGDYVTEVDKTNKRVTYKSYNTSYSSITYPDLFQYEEGGLIDGTATQGLVKQSESYSGYNGITTQTSSRASTNLTVPFTYYSITPEATDFMDTANAENLYNIFFETNTRYWLASRATSCSSIAAIFYLRTISQKSIGGTQTLNAYDNQRRAVCPIVHLPASAKLSISTDESEYHQSEPHVVQ